jgi:probable phosphoglycerate mutase
LNHLLDIDRLSNRYFAMRHGHSLANERAIIVSHPENGCCGYGLSESGRSQVAHSLSRANELDADTLVICSDFKRARESADIVHARLACSNPVAVERGLRERHFGKYELSADSGYEEVWRQDALDADSRHNGVESVNQVMQRVTRVVRDLEQRFSGASILLVSHGDALQIAARRFDSSPTGPPSHRRNPAADLTPPPKALKPAPESHSVIAKYASRGYPESRNSR